MVVELPFVGSVGGEIANCGCGAIGCNHLTLLKGNIISVLLLFERARQNTGKRKTRESKAKEVTMVSGGLPCCRCLC